MGRESGDEEVISEPRSSAFYLFHKTRLCILLLITTTFTFMIGNPLIYNFTVICMDDVVQEQTPSRQLLNATDQHNRTFIDEEIHWLEDSPRRNLLFSAVAIGTFVGYLPLTRLQDAFGTRNILVAYGLVSAAATAVFPLAVKLNMYSVIFLVRVIQGLGASPTFPLMGTVCNTWAAAREMTMALALVSTHLQLCVIFVMPVASAFCVSSAGWSGIFYFQAALTFVLVTLLLITYTDNPTDHKHVSFKELSEIAQSKPTEDERNKQKLLPIPYRAISSTPDVWAVWQGILGGNIGFLVLQQFGPIYLNKVLGLEVKSTGIALALPFVISFIIKVLGGPISDHSTCVSEKARAVFFCAFSQGFLAVCYVIMALLTDATLAQITYTAAVGFAGFNIMGTVRGAQMIGQQFTSFVLAVPSALTALFQLILPIVIAIVAESNEPSQWSLVFFGVAGIVVLLNIHVIFIARLEPAEWTKAGWTDPRTVIPSSRRGSKLDLETASEIGYTRF